MAGSLSLSTEAKRRPALETNPGLRSYFPVCPKCREVRSSPLNNASSRHRFFPLWESRSEGWNPQELNPELVPGYLRSFFLLSL